MTACNNSAGASVSYITREDTGRFGSFCATKSDQVLKTTAHHFFLENIMKTRIVVLTLAVFAVLNVGFGKGPSGTVPSVDKKIESAKANYTLGLQSDNAGVVESSIQMIARMKLRVPDANIAQLRERLNRISLNHPSAAMRYKAYLASCICADPEWFIQEKNLDNVDVEQFFARAAARLQQKVFGANSY